MLFNELVRIKVIFSIKLDSFNSFFTIGGVEIFVKSLANWTIFSPGNSSHVVIQIFVFLRTYFSLIVWTTTSIPSHGSTCVEVFVEGPKDTGRRLLLAFNNDVALVSTLIISISHYSLRTLLPNLFRFLHHDLGNTFSLVRYFELH